MSAPIHKLTDPKLSWIFVGGKGGVGKTTTSCAIAVMLAHLGKKVCLVSTDPASNLNDVFAQNFSQQPEPVNGVPNLYAFNGSNQMENIEAKNDTPLMMNLPGMDEVQTLSAMFQLLEVNNFDKVVFDTAPTGHTMKLLQLPDTADSIMSEKLFGSGMFNSISQMIGGSTDLLKQQGSDFKVHLKRAKAKLQNHDECTFIPVLIPEFSPMLETNRLISFLQEQEIDYHMMVINQILEEEKVGCSFCKARQAQQKKYLDDIEQLYGHDSQHPMQIVHVPQQPDEVADVESLEVIGQFLAPLFD